MDEKRMDTQEEERVGDCKENDTKPKKAKRFVMWTLAIGVPTALAIMLGIKNKDVILDAWDTIKEELKKGKLFSSKWFKNTPADILCKYRDCIHETFMNPETDQDIRNMCWNLLGRFDKELHDRQTAGKSIGFPVPREDGWYLPNRE